MTTKKLLIPQLLLEYGELSIKEIHALLWGSIGGTRQAVYKLGLAGEIKRSRQDRQQNTSGYFESFWVHHTRQRPPERMQAPTPYTKREKSQRWRVKMGEVARVRKRAVPAEKLWLQGLMPTGTKSPNYHKEKAMKFEFYREQVVVAHQYPAPQRGGEKPQGVGEAVTKAGDYHWRLLAANGSKVANPGEGYKRIDGMLKALRTIFGDSPKRCKELEKALKEWEKANGSLAKPFKFYTADSDTDCRGSV